MNQERLNCLESQYPISWSFNLSGVVWNKVGSDMVWDCEHASVHVTPVTWYTWLLKHLEGDCVLTGIYQLWAVFGPSIQLYLNGAVVTRSNRQHIRVHGKVSISGRQYSIWPTIELYHSFVPKWCRLLLSACFCCVTGSRRSSSSSLHVKFHLSLWVQWEQWCTAMFDRVRCQLTARQTKPTKLNERYLI